MKGDNIHIEKHQNYLKIKAKKALKKAKELEAAQLLSGKKFVKIGNRALVLR